MVVVVAAEVWVVAEAVSRAVSRAVGGREPCWATSSTRGQSSWDVASGQSWTAAGLGRGVAVLGVGVRVVVVVGEQVALEAWMVAGALSGKDDWFGGLVVWWW